MVLGAVHGQLLKLHRVKLCRRNSYIKKMLKEKKLWIFYIYLVYHFTYKLVSLAGLPVSRTPPGR